MKFNLHNSLNKGLVLIPAFVLSGIAFSHAQMLDDCIFLKGKAIEVGMAPIGCFGTPDGVVTPEGYHARTYVGAPPTVPLGFVADPAEDGWEVGDPDYIGCYFLPGVPQEGWDVAVEGDWSRAYRTDGGYSFTGDLDGENTEYYTSGPRVYGVWEGNVHDGGLQIKATTSFDTNQVFFVTEVKMKNTSSAPIDDIYYSRTLDPDNESAVAGGGGPVTNNTIVYQPDEASGDYKCLVSGVGINYPELSYLGLGAVDCRAKCYIYSSGGLYPYEGPDEIYENPDDNSMEKEDTYYGDVAIGIIFKIGTLNPGDSTVFTFTYVLSSADLDTSLNSLDASWTIDGASYASGDTLIKCWGSDMNAEINGGGAYLWGEWEASDGSTLPAGRTNLVHIDHTPLTYRVIGTTTICPVSDTLYMTFIPEGDSVIINKSICQGETEEFMGSLKYETGIYTNVVKTSIGCDSVVQLNLTVNPLPNVTISARETQICEGEEALFTLDNPSAGTTYQWKRDGANIPGATQHTYAAPSVPGVYSVSGVTSKGCTDDSRTITLTVNPKAEGSIVSISEQDVCIGDTVTVTSDGKPGYQYTWEPEAYFRYTSGNMNPSASGVIPGTTEVYLVSMNQYGCKDYDTAVVTAHPCCDIYIPTAFSPNNDGLNDEFAPKLRPGQKIIALQVFNRKGQLVYDNNSPQRGWNGKFNNSDAEAAQDVYMYRFVYTCTDGEVFETKGDITLIR